MNNITVQTQLNIVNLSSNIVIQILTGTGLVETEYYLNKQSCTVTNSSNNDIIIYGGDVSITFAYNKVLSPVYIDKNDLLNTLIGYLNVLPSLGAVTVTNTVQVAGSIKRTNASFIKGAATTYQALDVVTSNGVTSPLILEFPNAIGAGSQGYLIGAIIEAQDKTLTNSFRLHLFNTNSIAALTDGQSYEIDYNDKDKYLGRINFPAMTTEASGSTASYAETDELRKAILASGTSIYGILETVDTIVSPIASTQFSITLFIAAA